MKITHHKAKPSHYNKDAHLYDQFNEKNSQIINQTIADFLKIYNLKTVLDLTCGTGSQVFWLTEKGYDVTGVDINEKMLQIAKVKAQEKKQNIKFIQADMCNIYAGKFDSVISIFNSIGHLTKSDFKIALQNIYKNLKPNGIYIFDIFNLDYLLHKNNITKLTIDWPITKDNIKAREIQYSTIDIEGVLASYTIIHEQKNNSLPTISQSFQTLQVYTAKELINILNQSNFNVLHQTNINGSKFNQYTSERIVTIAQKV